MDREKAPLFIFGINAVTEKLKGSPREVFEVLIGSGPQSVSLRSIAEEARRLGVRVRFLDPGELDRLAAGGRHQRVLAKVAPYSYQPFPDLLGELETEPGLECILALDGVTDPRNFGALLRTAEGAGIRRILIPKDRCAGITPTVIKASAGAAHYLRICRVTNLRRAILEVKEKGYWVVGLDAQAREGIYGRAYPERLVVVLGAEGKGMRPLIREACDFLVSIPMRGQIASLNVAVSGGVFLYELLRQRSGF